MKLKLTLIFSVLWFMGFSQKEFTLKQAQDYAIQANERVKNAQIDLEIAQKKVRETTAIGLPQISGSLDFQNFIDIPTSVVPNFTKRPGDPGPDKLELKFGTEYTLNAGLQLTQIIFNGNYLVGLQAAKAYKNTSEVLIEKSKIDVKNDVASAYYTVLMLKNNIGTLEDSQAKMEELLNRTQILIDEDMIEKTQASQLKLSILQIQNGISKIKSQIEVAKNLLKMQMGMDLSEDIVLTENLGDFLDLELQLVENYNPTTNINHQVLETQLTLSNLNLKNKKANYLPSLTGFFSHKQSAQRNEFNFFDGDEKWYPTTIWGLSLNVPIYSSGKKKSQVDQAALKVIKTQNTLKQADRGLELKMKQAITNYKNAVDSYKIQQEAIKVAQEIVDMTVTKYKLGSALSLELTQVESQFLNTQSALNTAAFEVVQAKHEIDKLLNK